MQDVSNQATKTRNSTLCFTSNRVVALFTGGRSSTTRYNGGDDYNIQHPWILGARLSLSLSPSLADSLSTSRRCVAYVGGSSCSATTSADPLSPSLTDSLAYIVDSLATRAA